MFKMSTFCHSTLPTTTSHVDDTRNVKLPFLSSQDSMNTGFLDTNLARTLLQWLLLGSCRNLHDCISLSLLVELLFLPRRPFNASCTVPSTSNLSRILVILTLVGIVYLIQPSNVVELQHSPLSNNTSVTTYIHQMIISQPCLFKHTKNDKHVAVVFQCLLDHTKQKLYFCLISLLRNNVSKSVYINLRHSLVMKQRLQCAMKIPFLFSYLYILWWCSSAGPGKCHFCPINHLFFCYC